MSKLPSGLSGREAVKVFQRAGWTIARQTGSHIIMTKEGTKPTLSVPDHKSLDKGTLRTLIRYADLSIDKFVKLL